MEMQNPESAKSGRVEPGWQMWWKNSIRVQVTGADAETFSLQITSRLSGDDRATAAYLA